MARCKHTKQNSWWEYDAQGIPLCRVCDQCRAEKLKGYRPEILSGYDQSDVDEDIEPDLGVAVDRTRCGGDVVMLDDEPYRDAGVSLGDLARDAKDPHDIYS